jgi:hypothetical protein
MPPADRKAFVAQNHALLGADLAMGMESCIKLFHSRKMTTVMGAEGCWKDEVDIREMFRVP